MSPSAASTPSPDAGKPAARLPPPDARETTDANRCRYLPGRGGHVESYFLRANDPHRPRALWIKATILAPLDGEPAAELWFIHFDGETGRTRALRETWPLEGTTFATAVDRFRIAVGRAQFDLAADGGTRGEIEGDGGPCRWDLSFERPDTPVARTLSLFPSRLMVDGPFPRSKPLTPFPALRFRGSLDLSGETVSVDGWWGMQGHNWGREHAFEYAWGQCLFPGEDGVPDAMVEGFTGRVRVAGRLTPRLSALVVQRGERTYRFDRIFDYWRQQATVEGWRWALRLRGADGEASLTMDAAARPLVCLGYRNPDGRPSYCFNSKLSEVTLEVRPSDGEPFVRRSAHGGALEFLRGSPDPRLPRVV